MDLFKHLYSTISWRYMLGLCWSPLNIIYFFKQTKPRLPVLVKGFSLLQDWIEWVWYRLRFFLFVNFIYVSTKNWKSETSRWRSEFSRDRHVMVRGYRHPLSFPSVVGNKALILSSSIFPRSLHVRAGAEMRILTLIYSILSRALFQTLINIYRAPVDRQAASARSDTAREVTMRADNKRNSQAK